MKTNPAPVGQFLPASFAREGRGLVRQAAEGEGVVSVACVLTSGAVCKFLGVPEGMHECVRARGGPQGVRAA
jgi:hypothetical protein